VILYCYKQKIKERYCKLTFNISPTVGIYTLGCKVNQYESEAISELFAASGILPHSPSDVCDIYVINTCTVTAESDRKACQFIRRAIQKNPSAYVLVTGCLAQVDAERIAKIEGVDYISGNSGKLSVVKAALGLLERGEKNITPEICVDDINSAPFERMSINKFERTRAYVKIEDGCESKCAYCIIPSARGMIRSKPLDEVVKEVTQLVRGGCLEVVLTGIETASYGHDLENTDLATLLCEIDKIEGLRRIRLGSLDPSLIKPDFVKMISSLKKLTPHFHLSLQSGSSRVLALMRRKYNADMAMNAIELLRENIPDAKFTTDVIVGFPGESEEDFLETVEFARNAGFLMMHIFPYSKRAGTVAASMQGQVPSEIKKRRAAELSCVAKEIRAKLLSEVVADTPIRDVLFESYENGVSYGHTADFLEVAVESPEPIHSVFRKVKITHTDGNTCYGSFEN